MENTTILENCSYRILIVDDTPKNIQLLGTILRNEGYQLNAAENGLQVFDVLESVTPDLILLDVMMPEMDGFETCKRLKESASTCDIPVIFLTAKNETDDIVKGFRLGAVDYVSKPFTKDELLARVQSHLTIRTLHKEVEKQRIELAHDLKITQQLFNEASSRIDGPLLGNSDLVRKIRDQIFTCSKTDNPLLISGLSGSGDEAIARAIHRASPRKNQAFIFVNCLQHKSEKESNLFTVKAGEKGPHDEIEVGMIDLANNGTLYLYEIHHLSLKLQERLVKNLIESGNKNNHSDQEKPDIRVIIYTSQDLASSIQNSLINSDLYNFFNKNIIKIPSLLERRDDIPTLVNYYLNYQAKELGKNIEKISDKSMKCLQDYVWPGNIRELQNVIERSVLVATESIVEVNEELLNKGTRVDRYRLVKQIGEGGMGEVWSAKHQLLARPVALKLIQTSQSQNDLQKKAALIRFEREAQAIANLQSPNTIKLFDYGVSDQGAFYFVMELLSGMDLHSMVSQFGAMKAERVVMLLKQACRSLMEAHDIGFTHRDIKPQNLFVCKLGCEYDFLKVLDFGVVKHEEHMEEDSQITHEKEIPATPITVAPEILTGGDVDARSDLYSLGCVAYWMLTGKQVFTGKNVMELLMHHVSTKPSTPSRVIKMKIPEKLDTVVLACLEKDKRDRPQTAAELWEMFDEVKFSNNWTQTQAKQWWIDFMPKYVDQKKENKMTPTKTYHHIDKTEIISFDE